MSYQPPSNPGGQPPRSTPIPGQSMYSPPAEDAPQTAGQFLGSPGSYGTQGPYGTQLPLQGIQYPTQPTTRRRRSIGGSLVMFLIIAGIVGGIGFAIWGVMKAKSVADDAINQGNELSDPQLSSNDRDALGLDGNEQFLFYGGAPAALATVFDEAIPGEPTNFTQVGVYGDYAFATAQSPTQPDHLDEYGWRLGEVSAPTPEANDADAPNQVFTMADVNWEGVAALATDALRLGNVEDGKVSHILIQRDTFAADHTVVVRIYVSGPRGSAVIEGTADGTFLRTF